jgi:hypothetical protein
MAVADILAQTGDKQDFVIEIPAGNPTYVPVDSLTVENQVILCAEIPTVAGPGGGNIFIMSE